MIDAKKASTLAQVYSIKPSDLVVFVSETGVPETTVIAAADLFAQLMWRVAVPPSLFSPGLPGQYAMDDTWFYTYFSSRWQKLRRDGVTVPGGWTLVSTARSLLGGDKIMADSTAGSVSHTFPAAPSIGTEIEIMDPYSSWATHPVTLLRNGHLIAGIADDLLLQDAGVWLRFVFVGGTVGWKLNDKF